MRIWRLSKERYASDAFSGEGARRFGGRWNSPGVPMVYTSTSLALAAIELFVHLDPSQAPLDLVSIAADLPEGEPSLRWEQAQLPPRWWSDALGPVRSLGDQWARSQKSLSVFAPSVPIRGEWNVLVNPRHPGVAGLIVHPPEPFLFDARMFSAR
jgi:RES domain-containing protein